MNQQEDRDRVSDVIQFEQAVLCPMRPLARQIFTAQASSAASEPVFSKAGLIMRPARSQFNRANVSKLVFLELYREAVVTSNRQVCHTNAI